MGAPRMSTIMLARPIHPLHPELLAVFHVDPDVPPAEPGTDKRGAQDRFHDAVLDVCFNNEGRK